MELNTIRGKILYLMLAFLSGYVNAQSQGNLLIQVNLYMQYW